MARITIEDCLARIPNRFELVLIASKRARHLMHSGEDPKVAWENDKATVVALREIASGFVTRDYMDLDLNADIEEADATLSNTEEEAGS